MNVNVVIAVSLVAKATNRHRKNASTAQNTWMPPTAAQSMTRG